MTSSGLVPPVSLVLMVFLMSDGLCVCVCVESKKCKMSASLIPEVLKGQL